MNYRTPSKIDAERLWEMMNQLDYETKYMLYEPGERLKNLTKIESLINNSVEGDDFLMVAEKDDKIVGYISAQKGALKRICQKLSKQKQGIVSKTMPCNIIL